MTYANLEIALNNKVQIITINRPKQLNALNKQTIEELNSALIEAERNESVRVLIITGSGGKAFVAGADIKEFADFSVNEGTELAAKGQELLFNLIQDLKKPVIAAINGFALGGGLELAMSCHIRVASDNARMGLPETSLGVIPGYGGTQRLAQLIGKGRAMEMIFTADMIKADRAYEIGLVNHVVTQEDLLGKAEEIAAKMIKNSPMALASAICSVNAGFKANLDGLKIEIEEFGKCFGTPEFVEGTTAFLEKRKAEFN